MIRTSEVAMDAVAQAHEETGIRLAHARGPHDLPSSTLTPEQMKISSQIDIGCGAVSCQCGTGHVQKSTYLQWGGAGQGGDTHLSFFF